MTPVRRSIAIALAVVYGLSTGASVLFHNHGTRCGQHVRPVAESSHVAEHSGCCAHAQPEHTAPQPPPPPCPGDEEDCFVCHSLGQKPIQAAGVSQVVSAVLVDRSTRPEPIRLPVELSPSLQSRAPPIVA